MSAPLYKEAWYYVRDGNIVRQDNLTSESMELRAEHENVSLDMVEELTGTGVLAGGAMPGFDAEGEDGQKNLLEKLTGEPTIMKKNKASKNKATKGGDPEEVTPRTPLEAAQDKMSEILKDGSKSRELALALGASSYGGELREELQKFNQRMEKLFKKLQSLVASKTNKRKILQPLLDFADEQKKWFETAQVLRVVWLRAWSFTLTAFVALLV